MGKLEFATAALRLVAEEFCKGDAGVLNFGGSNALMMVIGALKELGEAEEFELREQLSGSEHPHYKGTRLKPGTKAAEQIATFLPRGPR